MTNFHVGQKVWVPVAGYEGLYEVSSFGDVRSLRTGKVLKGSPIPAGYLTVALHKDGKQTTCTIHRLVCKAFHANPDGKPAVNHIDGTRANNAAYNLEWVTFQENTAHGVAMGTIVGVPRKVPENHRDEIRRLYASGKYSQRLLASRFGVTKNAVAYIVKEAMLKPKKARADA